jgi:Zn-finger nucleic acid-binding protein
MDLGGRISGYRGVAIRCPGCGEPMLQDNVGDAEVDVCATCGGIWLDWFDGETGALAIGVLDKESSGMTRHPSTPDTPRNEPRATGACPRCTRQLAVERYMATSIEDGQRHERSTGADLLRCADCMGVFLSRSSAEMIVAIANEDGPRSLPPANVQAAFWERIVSVLRKIFGG